MEMHSAISNPQLTKKTSKITLEDYLDFIESRKQLDLTNNTLNQIISIHGFRKLKEKKNVLIDALNSMDLVHPSRSTINDDDVSSYAFISMKEAMKDIFDLSWIECPVTSLQTLNPVNHEFGLQNSHPSTSKSKPKKSKTSLKTKVTELKDVAGDMATVVIDTGLTGSGDEPFLKIGEPQSASSAAVDTKNRKRKKTKSGNSLITVSNSTNEFSKVRSLEDVEGDVAIVSAVTASPELSGETESAFPVAVDNMKRVRKSVNTSSTDFLFY